MPVDFNVAISVSLWTPTPYLHVASSVATPRSIWQAPCFLMVSLCRTSSFFLGGSYLSSSFWVGLLCFIFWTMSASATRFLRCCMMFLLCRPIFFLSDLYWCQPFTHARSDSILWLEVSTGLFCFFLCRKKTSGQLSQLLTFYHCSVWWPMGVQLQYIFFSFLYQLLQESSGSVPDVAETMMISFLCTISKMPFYHPTMLAVQQWFLHQVLAIGESCFFGQAVLRHCTSGRNVSLLAHSLAEQKKTTGQSTV